MFHRAIMHIYAQIRCQYAFHMGHVHFLVQTASIFNNIALRGYILSYSVKYYAKYCVIWSILHILERVTNELIK